MTKGSKDSTNALKTSLKLTEWIIPSFSFRRMQRGKVLGKKIGSCLLSFEFFLFSKRRSLLVLRHKHTELHRANLKTESKNFFNTFQLFCGVSVFHFDVS